ncbi:MAG: DegQ family serine endoprotease [Blastocatellia bacterium]
MSSFYKTLFGMKNRFLSSLLSAALLVTAGTAVTMRTHVFGQQSASQPQVALPSPADLSRTFISVAKQVKPAVVNIDVVEKPAVQTSQRQAVPQIPGFPPFGFGQQAPRKQRGTGSGVIVSPDGYILTNNHVAGDASEINVKLADGSEHKAKLIGNDPETDLAVIKIDGSSFPYAKLGDSSRLEQGEWVIALGSPFGLEQTMTAGIVSATARDLRSGPYDNYIQTDASINPGNSGGPLVNMQGEVIGINTMIFSRSGGSEGIGFAIPASLGQKVYSQLVKNGKVSRGYLGLNLQNATPTLAKSLGYEGITGALIGDVAKDGPAVKAGLQSGDLIVEFDSKKVTSAKQLTEMVADTASGKSVQLKYLRDGRTQTATIQIGERPSRNQTAARVLNDDSQGLKLGVSVGNVTPEIAAQLKLKVNSGAVIQSVQPGSAAAEAGLQEGDVIHRVNRTTVTSVESLTSALRSLKGEKEVVLQIERNGQLNFVTVSFE